FPGWERFYLAEPFRVDATRGGNEFVVEKMIERAGAGLPANVLDLARLSAAAGIGVGFRCVIIIAALGGPVGVDLRVECPVGDVKAFDGVRERGVFQFVRREPAAAVPATDGIANLTFAELHRQQAFGRESLFDFFVRHERRGTAKIATLAHASRIENRNRLATLALNGNLDR